MSCETCPLSGLDEREQMLVFADKRARDLSRRTRVLERTDPIPMSKTERRADSNWYSAQHKRFESECEQGLLGEVKIDGEFLAIQALRGMYSKLPVVDTTHG